MIPSILHVSPRSLSLGRLSSLTCQRWPTVTDVPIAQCFGLTWGIPLSEPRLPLTRPHRMARGHLASWRLAPSTVDSSSRCRGRNRPVLWSPPSLQEFTAQVGGHLDRCWEQKSGSADRVCVCGWVLLRITFPQPEGDQVDYSKTCLKGAPFLAEAFILDSEWEETRATGRPAG